MAKRKRRGPTLDDKFLGPKPSYGEHNPIPTDPKEMSDEFRRGTYWYYYNQNHKKAEESVLKYCTLHLNFSKKELANIKKIEKWRLRPLHKFVSMVFSGWPVGVGEYGWDELEKKLREFERQGSLIKKEESQKPKPPVISPQERTKAKVMDTIYADWDEVIVDGWFDGNYTQKFGAYNRFKLHGLKSNSIKIFKDMLMMDYENITEAYNKTCEQCVEAYSHMSKPEKRKMIKQFDDVFADLDRLRDSFKSQRTPRLRKRRTSDAQVSKLQYCQEDIESKLTSINPILVPGKNKVYIYNRKTRKLIEYVCSSIDGIEISGTSIKNFDEASRQATVRKPDEVLPDILNRTELQIDKIWNSFTTKITKPTGRINKDCIIMRVM